MSAQASTSVVENAPTPQQLLFAKSIYFTFELWPAMRLAVSEQWGGPDSADKRDFLLSHLCDQYGNPGSAFEPDLDDLADILEGYMIDEYEARLEDGSPDWVAGRIVGLHRVIFSPNNDLASAQAAVAELEKAYEELKGKKATVQQGVNQDDEVEAHSSEDEDMRDARIMAQQHGGVTEADRQGARVGLEQDQARATAPREPQQPIIDDDGFETVVSRRRRK
ncbi:related to TSR2 - protein with a potential role in pre-rRNA processing [Melanopsichium pennsylvanicum]|uniref:Related to TSR2 - protein with a potential role in pre-rRNA processing n=2 Tax=Melanopsichium pennsylvanicum TaxID=63383 RepID=A0AAJ4XP20_9BASI|nr:conserved hypothetical protein [Melanopsichium pennsylvanicum 4]SNX85870.1 related to TSR2 - protein with a potential role in pre-rRNA processing [Melanopsichium pennsylvanicum]